MSCARKTNQPPAALPRSSPEPLYRQLADLLESAIRGGELKPGDRLDSEGVLAERYGVSRITLRQAVEALVRKQLAGAQAGQGDLRHQAGGEVTICAGCMACSARCSRRPRARAPASALRTAHAAGRCCRGVRPCSRAATRCRWSGSISSTASRSRSTAAWLVPAVAALPRAKAELISTEDMMRAVGIQHRLDAGSDPRRGRRREGRPAAAPVRARAGAGSAPQRARRRTARRRKSVTSGSARTATSSSARPRWKARWKPCSTSAM